MNAPDRPKPPEGFDENPEWTAADTEAARRGAPWEWPREQELDRLRETVSRLANTPPSEWPPEEEIHRGLREAFPHLVKSD